MNVLHIVVGLVIIQRLTELLYSARNTRALKQDGAVEIGRGHYPLFILLHGTWLLSLLVLVPGDEPVHRPMLLIFAGLQVTRLWIVTALGRFWTTRIITIPNVPLVTRGPYRYLHQSQLSHRDNRDRGSARRFRRIQDCRYFVGAQPAAARVAHQTRIRRPGTTATHVAGSLNSISYQGGAPGMFRHLKIVDIEPPIVWEV